MGQSVIVERLLDANILIVLVEEVEQVELVGMDVGEKTLNQRGL
jgi:hypothetical protein